MYVCKKLLQKALGVRLAGRTTMVEYVKDAMNGRRRSLVYL